MEYHKKKLKGVKSLKAATSTPILYLVTLIMNLPLVVVWGLMAYLIYVENLLRKTILHLNKSD